MNSLWKKPNIATDMTSSAKVVDGNLIISLPDALNPIVWRMELGSVKASALEVRKQADGTHLLVLKTPKGDVHEIAPFTARDTAVTALMRVSEALQDGEGKFAPAATSVIVGATPATGTAQPAYAPARPVRDDAAGYKWLIALGAVLAVIVLFAYLARTAPTATIAQSIPGEETATSITGQPNAESGVPQSADELLRGY